MTERLAGAPHETGERRGRRPSTDSKAEYFAKRADFMANPPHIIWTGYSANAVDNTGLATQSPQFLPRRWQSPKEASVRRWVYEQHYGPVPDGARVFLDYDKCDVPACVYAPHLTLQAPANWQKRAERTA
jgi:hypothetical protein